MSGLYILNTVAGGLVAGIVFGFLLQKGGVSQFNVIVRQFLFTDFTVIKVMLTAIVVGGLGVYTLNYFDIIPLLDVAVPAHLGVLVGGLLFGVGMATLGLCPGTCVAAAGQGSYDAWFGILGMLKGAAVFITLYPWLKGMHGIILTHAATVWQLLGISPFLLLGILLVSTVLFFKFIRD